MKNLKFPLIAGCFALAACGGSEPTADVPVDPVTAAISGKTLVSGGSRLELADNKELSGVGGPEGDVDIAGAWEIREGQFCRTLEEPPQLAGTECQDIAIDGETATISGLNGPVTYIIQ